MYERLDNGAIVDRQGWSNRNHPIDGVTASGLFAPTRCAFRTSSGLAPKAYLLCQCGARLRILRSDHRVIARQVPLIPVLLRREFMVGHQVSLQHRKAFAIFQADNAVRPDRLLHRYSWCWFFDLRGSLTNIK